MERGRRVGSTKIQMMRVKENMNPEDVLGKTIGDGSDEREELKRRDCVIK